MGLSYGTGNLGKFIGPLGLSLIMGAGDIIKPAAPNLAMLGPAFLYFASFCFLECGRPDRLLDIRSRTQGSHL